jgi:arylsulfatase
MSNAGIIYGMLAVSTQFLDTFKDFPPSQRAGSFGIDQAVERLRQSIGQ